MDKKYRYLFFDLDGTISNSYEGIAATLDELFAHYGVDVDRSLYRKYIGPPLSDTFRKYFHTPEKVNEAVEWFRNRYTQGGIFLNPMYEGMKDVMCKLKQRGYDLCVATCKKLDEAQLLMKHFGIDKYLTYVSGLEYGVREHKAEILIYGMEQVGACPENSLMIGDTIYDIDGAREAGVDCVLCKWGFADDNALSQEVVFKADKPEDLLQFLQ